MSVSGLQRLRKLQIGFQTSYSSNTAATKVLPYRGSIDIDPQLTDPDVDTGSLDPTMAPFAGAAEYTSEWEGKLAYNDALRSRVIAGQRRRLADFGDDRIRAALADLLAGGAVNGRAASAGPRDGVPS